MKAVKTNTRSLAEARRLEQEGEIELAAAAYQQVLAGDPANEEAVERLLVIYRKQKEYKKELAVIEGALSAYEDRDKAIQEKWIAAHPEAAKVGRQFLRSLGGASVSAFGSNRVVGRLLKRKEVVEKRLGKKGKAAGTGQRRKGAVQKRQEAAARKKKGAAEARRQAAARQESPAVARKKTAEERKAAAQKKKEQEAEAKREAAEAAKKAAIEVKMYPSLFVISLRYLVSLEKIDAVMKKHVAFLDKHFAVGDFLVSGRQVPRTGGIIVARAKDRASVERIMKQDPLLKGQLASVDIVEFTASKMDKGFDKLLRRGRG